MEDNNSNLEYNNRIKQQLPSSVATLVLGILSLVFSFCCWTGGIVSIVLGIIALTISTAPLKIFNENPMLYDGIGNLRAGRIMAIIALSISSLYLIGLIIYISIAGFAALSIGSILESLK